MSVLRERHAIRRDTEMLQYAMLKLVFEYLPVAVNNESALDGVEHDTAPRPLLIFGITYNAGNAARRAPGSPAFPEVVMSVWTGEAVSVFFSVG
jgi:hypothetical protein